MTRAGNFFPHWALLVLLTLSLGGLKVAPAESHEPDFTANFDRDRCTFVTVSNHPWHPLWPGYSALLEGEEDDEGETITITLQVSVLEETEIVDGIRTRVLEEREWEDGDLVEVSRNFVAACRETGDIWYFGEDVDDYEDGVIVGHEGEWRAGRDGAVPGLLMPGNPLNGARYFQEMAPDAEALDQAEVQSRTNLLTVPAGTFPLVLHVVDTTPLEPSAADDKYYAYGFGLIKDAEAELISLEIPDCIPDDQTLCLQEGRFRVTGIWRDFEGRFGPAQAVQASNDSGEFWFFGPNNTELLVKVLDACTYNDRFWAFAAGLTNVEVTLVVTDTESGQVNNYFNPLGNPYTPVLDTDAFATCP